MKSHRKTVALLCVAVALLAAARAGWAGTTNLMLVAEGAACRYRIPTDGSLGLDWTRADGFDDSGWPAGASGIGYEIPTTNFASLIRTRVSSSTIDVYTRFSFVVTNLSGYGIMTLRVKYDDGFVAYLNGTKVAEGNAPAFPQWSSLATAAHPLEQALVYAVFNLGPQIGLLRTGTNVLAVHGLNVNLNPLASDLLLLPVLDLTSYVPPQAGGVTINEVHYNPDSEIEFVEFVELLNAGTSRVDMAGWYFSNGISYTFPANTFLDAGASLVVAQDPASFSNKFHVACRGPYEGQLASQGEKLTLRNASATKVDEVDYKVGFPWPTCGDAPGYSMQMLHPALDNELGGSWRSGPPTPGATNSVYVHPSLIPPQIRQVDHTPVQPTHGEPIVVTAKITDLDGVVSARLRYQAVPPGGYIPAFLPLDHTTLLASPLQPRSPNPAFSDPSSWVELLMRDDGHGGDAKADDSIFTGVIPGQTNRTLVRYRITAADSFGNPVDVPYADDAGLNFACFVYNGVPPYQPLKATVHPAGLGHIYGTNVMRSLPVYSLITRSQDLAECIAYSGTFQIPKGNLGRSIENWEGAFVYDGVVYDHINYRLLGANGRYMGGGKRSMHINFNRGHYVQACDPYGRKYPEKWKTMLTAKMFGNRSVGGYGMVEAMDGALFRMAGVPAPFTHWFHFRVLDGTNEAPADINGQHYGDFWGLSLAVENYDGPYLEAHGLPDGNLYKLTDEGTSGKAEQRSQGRYAVTNAEDYFWIRNNLNNTQTESWLTTNVNFPAWYRFHTVAEAIRHYDYWVACNKNMAWFFEPATGNPYGRLVFLPFDYDDTWGPFWNGGVDEAKAAITQSLGKPALKQEYRNCIREFRDLIWQPEVINTMLDDLAAMIRDFVPADRDRWKDAPADAGSGDFGTLENKVADMKNFAWVGGQWPGDGGTAPGRATVLDALANEEGDEASLPYTPTVSAVGPTGFPLNALRFQSGPFTDPQGNATFAAMKWRVGEITDTNAPAFDPTLPRIYEAPAVWESGDISNFTAQVTLPAGALGIGRRYRVRVCMKDNTGRWSHWSPPVTFTTAEPDSTAQLMSSLRISELMANPPGGNTFEFVELHNANPTEPLALNGVRFVSGISFTFPADAVLPPLGYLLVTGASPTNNFAAFRSRYGLGPSVPIAGPWAGNLNDAGEQVTLATAAGGAAIASFTYSDGRDWPLAAAGTGHSLVPSPQFDQAGDALNWGGNWRASAYLGGSPGREDPPPIRDVVINEFMAHTDYTNPAMPEYDSDDWIELYNASAAPVPIGGWYLSDDAADLKKWAIPATNVLAPHGWTVFDEVTGFHHPITNGFGLSKYGEQIYLSYLAGTTNDRVVDCVAFKGQENGVSEGRYPDGETPGYALEPAPRAANRLAGRHVVISEIVYHPAPTAENPENNTNDEYVEIYNPTDSPVQLMAEGGAWRLDGAVTYGFPTNTTIGAREYLLAVSFDPTNAAAMGAFRRAYSLTNGQVRILGPCRGGLPNRGGRVALERPVKPDLPGDPTGWFIVDEVVYGTAEPWPAGAGATLNRLSAEESGNNPTNWMAAPAATPGGAAPRVVLAAPAAGTSFMAPFVTPLRAVVDANQVVGGVARVEFLEGSDVIGIDASAPYACDAAGTEARAYRFAARVVDAGGSNVSPAVAVYGLTVDNAAGATAIAETAASLNGQLTGGGSARVTVYWGESDGGTNPAAWAHNRYLGNIGGGGFTTRVNDLVLGRQYYYRCYAETGSGGGWASGRAVFNVSFDAWQHRMKITFAGYNRPAAISNFPALVALGANIAGFSYRQMASAAGGDLRFLDGGRTTALNYEIETWNTNGTSLVWVQVPRLSGPTDAIWACWGNAAATNPPDYTRNGATWSEGYRAVWHLNGDLADATINRTTAADHGSAGAPGLVGQGRAFGGGSAVDPRLDADWYYDTMQHMTISLWVSPAAGTNGATPFGALTSPLTKPFLIQQSGGSWRFAVNNIAPASTEHGVDVGRWQHLALVLNGGQGHAYKNGIAPASTFAYATFAPTYAPWLGRLNGFTDPNTFFSGLIDDVRVSDTVRSPDWVWAEHMTAGSNAAFTAYSPVVDAQSEDLNGDGIPDAWQRHYFSDGGPDTAADEDWDKDGAANRAEYIAGTDPTNSASFLHIEAVSPLSPAASVCFLSSSGRLYTLEWRTSLTSGAWSDLTGRTNLPGDGAMMWLTDTNPGPAKFLRLRVRTP